MIVYRLGQRVGVFFVVSLVCRCSSLLTDIKVGKPSVLLSGTRPSSVPSRPYLLECPLRFSVVEGDTCSVLLLAIQL